MVDSTVARLAIAAFALSLPGCGSSELQPGDPAPNVSTGSDLRDVTVLWVVRAQDCLSCQTAAPTMRHLQRRFANNVEIVVVAVSDEEELVNSFLRAERLDVPVVHVDRRQYANLFGRTPVPAVHVIHGGRVVATWHRVRGVLGATTGASPALWRVISMHLAWRANVAVDPRRAANNSLVSSERKTSDETEHEF